MVPGTVPIVPLTAVRDELVVALEETLQLARRLAADARDGEVPVAELVAQASLLGRRDQRREDLIGPLRREASANVRAARPGLPSGPLLDRLDELGWPQNTGSSRNLWAKRELRLTAARSPGSAATSCEPGSARRRALRLYRAALNPDGSANPRWSPAPRGPAAAGGGLARVRAPV